MCGCFVLLLGAVAPRFALFLMALFNDEITRAFDGSWIMPLHRLVPAALHDPGLRARRTGGRGECHRVRAGSSWPWLRRRPRLLHRWLQPALGLPAYSPPSHVLSPPVRRPAVGASVHVVGRSPSRHRPPPGEALRQPASTVRSCLHQAPIPDGREPHGNQGGHQRIRPHRPDGVPCCRPELPGHDPGRRNQRPARRPTTWPTCSSTTRCTGASRATSTSTAPT